MAPDTKTNGANGEKAPTPENMTMFQGFEWNVRCRNETINDKNDMLILL